MNYSDWMCHRMKAAEDKQNDEQEERSMEEQYSWITTGHGRVRVPSRLITSPADPNAVPQFERDGMESEAYIRRSRLELKERGFSEAEINTLLSGATVAATSSQAIVEPENYTIKNKRPIITQKMIKNAIENRSLASSMDRMEEVIRDQIQKVVKEELNSDTIFDAPELVDKVAHVMWHKDSYTDPSIGIIQHGHPSSLNRFTDNVILNGGEIVSIQYLNDSLDNNIAMIHYKAPRDVVITI